MGTDVQYLLVRRFSTVPPGLGQAPWCHKLIDALSRRDALVIYTHIHTYLRLGGYFRPARSG